MKRFVNILMMTLAVIVLASCSANPDVPKRRHHKRPLLVPAASGNPYEVLVVTEDSMWNGYAGKALRVVLNKDVPMLPQREPMFHVSHIVPSNFNRITNIFRNIIILQTSEFTTKPKISIERDVHSSPQLIMTIQGPSSNELSSYITEQTRTITQNLTAEEINRDVTAKVRLDNLLMPEIGFHCKTARDYYTVDLQSSILGFDSFNNLVNI